MTIVVKNGQYALFDEMAERVTGWTMDCVQLSAADGVNELLQVTTPELQFSRVLLSAPFIQRGAASQGYRTFGLMAPGSSEVSWCNHRITPTSIVVFPASGEYESVSRAGFHVYSVSLSLHLIRQVAQQTLGLSVDDLLQEEGMVVQCRADQVSILRLLFCQLNECVLPETGECCPNTFGDIGRDLCRQLLQCIDDSVVARRDENSTKRRRAVKQCLALIESADIATLNVAQLVQHSGVSQRTLEYAFMDHFSTTPHQYLKALKMHKAHRALWQADARDDCSVAEIARASGFEHSGQFARDYHAIYGVLPSHTFRR